MKTIFELILFALGLYVLIGYFLGFVIIFFQGRIIEGSLLLIAVAVVDKVNEDRYREIEPNT